MESAVVSSYIHLRPHDKVLSLVAWAIAVALFASVGWMALQPDDPRGAVSLLTRAGAWLTILEIMALSAVVSGLATVLVGRKLPDAGVFAVALGLAGAALRGDTTAYLLINLANSDTAARGALAWKLAGEGMVWFLVVAVAMISAGVVTRWHAAGAARAAPPACRAICLADMPVLGGLLAPSGADQARRARFDGLKTMCVSLVAAAILFRLFVTGSPLGSVQHGQTCFALVAALYLGGLIAYELYPARSAFWGCLSVPLLCLLGYVICALSSPPGGQYSDIASVPPSSFYRALPIQYISVGTVGAVASFWSARRSAALRQVGAEASLTPRCQG